MREDDVSITINVSKDGNTLVEMQVGVAAAVVTRRFGATEVIVDGQAGNVRCTQVFKRV